jgi:hypothetical protein
MERRNSIIDKFTDLLTRQFLKEILKSNEYVKKTSLPIEGDKIKTA